MECTNCIHGRSNDVYVYDFELIKNHVFMFPYYLSFSHKVVRKLKVQNLIRFFYLIFDWHFEFTFCMVVVVVVLC